jgi:hypothetical protein
MSGNLERRYRRVLRLLPGWYRQQWEQDMVAAFLDSWLTGDPETDECVLEFCKPGWAETASVACLAVRLHLGGPGTPRRYAWPHTSILTDTSTTKSGSMSVRLSSGGNRAGGHPCGRPAG